MKELGFFFCICFKKIFCSLRFYSTKLPQEIDDIQIHPEIEWPKDGKVIFTVFI
jgi:hypothetical protein